MVTLSDGKGIFESRSHLTDDGVFYAFDTSTRGEIRATVYREPAWPETGTPWIKYLSVWDALDAYAGAIDDMDLAETVAIVRQDD